MVHTQDKVYEKEIVKWVGFFFYPNHASVLMVVEGQIKKFDFMLIQNQNLGWTRLLLQLTT